MGFRFVVLLVFMTFLNARASGSLDAYQLGNWSQVVSARAGKPMIVHFWGVTCGPCLSEMPVWARFASQHPDQVVFVEVDQAPRANVKNLSAKLHIDGYKNYYVQGFFDERMRFEIDRQWQGETPYTVVLSRNGEQNGFSGLANFKQLENWMKSTN